MIVVCESPRVELLTADDEVSAREKAAFWVNAPDVATRGNTSDKQKARGVMLREVFSK